MATESPTKLKLSMTQWMVCVIASIGFAFDIYELLMLPLIVRPALMELVGAAPGTPEFAAYVGQLFYIPAIAGGIFGLLGGWLTDVFGRRRVLTFSILLYACGAFCAGFSTSVEMLLFFRCLVFVGVCVEFVAAVAWLAELFPNPQQREKVLGYTQAFSSIGGLLVAVANGLCVTYSDRFPTLTLPDFLNFWGGAIQEGNSAWRFTLISGLIPAIPLILIRPFLPESPVWKKKKDSGTLKRPSIAALFSPQLRRTTIVTTIMFALAYGAAFGALQHIQRIVPGIPSVQAKAQEAGVTASEGLTGPAAAKASAIAGKKVEQGIAAGVTKVQEVGGLVGRFLLAVLILKFASRQKLIRTFQLPGLFIIPIVFGYIATNNLNLLYFGIFFCGLLTVGQFSFWGNYLPTAYPLHLRGTGESFAANIGGRLIGTSFAYVTATLSVQTWMPGDSPAKKLAYTAAGVGLMAYLIGYIVSFWLPEPNKEFIDED
ncbi:MAG: MFS transporter [Verrucomicrobia bacterium]|jgi:MFS family permease|nr:MFS transporter [Verrucomicrobiota bacterium]